VTGRVIDLDDELLAAARREVTTSGVSDTVRAALRQAASARACVHGRAVLGHLERGQGRAGVGAGAACTAAWWCWVISDPSLSCAVSPTPVATVEGRRQGRRAR
jgi:hypothetical protein